MIVYLITNDFDDNAYVGYHIGNNLHIRWAGHLASVREGSKSFLHNSMRKHGIEHFFIVPVWSGYIPIQSLKELEKFYIKCFKTKWPNGYNLTSGGEGVDSDCMKRIWKDPEYRAKMKLRPKPSNLFQPGYASPKKGGHREDISPEVRKQMSDKAKKYNEEHGNPRQGAIVSQTTRDKISRANKGKKRAA
jgi:group I intron endonuclease